MCACCVHTGTRYLMRTDCVVTKHTVQTQNDHKIAKVAEPNDQATSVVGRPGKRWSRKTLTKQGKAARPGPLYVRAEFTGPVRLQYHPQQQRIQRAGVFGREALVQLTNGHCCPAPTTASAAHNHSSATCVPHDTVSVIVCCTTATEIYSSTSTPHQPSKESIRHHFVHYNSYNHNHYDHHSSTYLHFYHHPQEGHTYL